MAAATTAPATIALARASPAWICTRAELVPEFDEASSCMRAEQPAASSASKAMAASLMAAILRLAAGAPQAVVHRGPLRRFGRRFHQQQLAARAVKLAQRCVE